MFIIENQTVKISPEILLIPLFREIWEEDTTPKKEFAMQTFSFIEFSLSPKKTNPFAGYTSGQQRELKILKALNITIKNLHPRLGELLQCYKEFIDNSSPSMPYYRSALNAADKLKFFFDTFTFTERNSKTGAPIYKPSDITRALKETQQVIVTLEGLKEKIEKELKDNRTTGNRQINPFEQIYG